jgi:cytoskeletal protein RodZ
MDHTTQLLLLIAAAAVGLVALLLMIGRQQRDRSAATRESPFATSTEGEKRCPNCGMGNLWTESRCSACKTPLRG